MRWKSSENQYGRHKKISTKFFLKKMKIPPPPLKKILDPPLTSSLFQPISNDSFEGLARFISLVNYPRLAKMAISKPP